MSAEVEAEQDETFAVEEEPSTLNEPSSNDDDTQQEQYQLEDEEQLNSRNEEQEQGEGIETHEEEPNISSDLIATDQEKIESKVDIAVDPHEAEYQEQLQRNREKNQEQLTEKTEERLSYYTNTEKEQRVLDYVENFDRQYQLLFPHRKALVMNMKNEFDSVKVSTSTHNFRNSFARLSDRLNFHTRNSTIIPAARGLSLIT
jgi:hypothetical protein